MSKDIVRVNTRLSKKMNDWLDKRSAETGISKSSLIYLALEQYQTQLTAINSMAEIESIIERLDEVKRAVERK